MGSLVTNEFATAPADRDGYGLTRVNTVVPALGAATVDFSLGDFHQMLMPAGDVVLTFLNPTSRIGSFRIFVAHNAAAFNLTFPTVYFENDIVPSARVYALAAGTAKRTEFIATFDGAAYSVKPVDYAQPAFLPAASLLDLILGGDPTTPGAGHLDLYAKADGGAPGLYAKDVDGRVVPLRESYVLVKNMTGGALAAGQAVRLVGGALGVPLVNVAVADTEANAQVLGVLGTAVADGGFGRAWTQGVVGGIDTSTYAVGDLLYLSSTVPGGLTTVAPAWAVPCARVLTVDVSVGQIQVNVGYRTLPGISSVGGNVVARGTTLLTTNVLDTSAPSAVPVDFSLGDLFGMNMPDADCTLVFSNPRRGRFTIVVAHHATNDHTLTFPSAYFEGGTALEAKVLTLAAGSGTTEFSVTFEGVAYHIQTDRFSTGGGGSGVGGINYITNFDAEVNTAGWVVYNDRVDTYGEVTTQDVGDTLTLVSHGFVYGDSIILSGAVFSGLVRYFVVNPTANTFQVAATRGGAVIPMTGDFNLISVVRVTATDGTGGTPAITWDNAEVAAPLRGLKSFRLVNAGGQAGEGVAYDFVVDVADRGRQLNLTFDFELKSGTFADGDLEVWVYDVTNAQIIWPQAVTVTGASSSVPGQFTTCFYTNPTSSNYRLILHNVSAVAYTMLVDNVKVGPDNVMLGSPITTGERFNMVITGSTTDPVRGTGVTEEATWQRVGGYAEIFFSYAQTGAGSAGSGTYFFKLPNGWLIDPSRFSVPNSQFAVPIGNGTIYDASGVTQVTTVYTIPSRLDSVTINLPSTSWNLMGSANFPFSSASLNFGFRFRVPILGWGSTVQMSSLDSARPVLASVDILTTTTFNSSGVVIYDHVRKDTHGMYDLLTGKFTIKVAGEYEIFGMGYQNGAAPVYFRIAVNGIDREYIGNIQVAANLTELSGVITDLKVGDYLEVKCSPSGAGSLGGSGIHNVFTLKKTATPQSIFLDGISSRGGIVQAKGYGYPSVYPITPVGTAFTLDCQNGDIQSLTMPASAATVAFANARPGAYQLKVVQNATAGTLTFPSLYEAGVGLGTPAPNLNAGAGKRTTFNLTYDGFVWELARVDFY